MQDWLKKKSVQLFHSENDDMKACLAERLIRTIRSPIAHVMTDRQSHEFYDVLPAIVRTYNDSLHRSHGFTPNSVNDSNSLKVFNALYAKSLLLKPRRPKLYDGDTVRIAMTKTIFDKGYAPNFSKELFRIVKVIRKKPFPVYRIESITGETIHGIFYEQELCLVKRH